MIRRLIFSIILTLLIVAASNAQQIHAITARCPTPNRTIYSSILAGADGNITYTPCPNAASVFTGNVDLTSSAVTLGSVHLIDKAFTNSLFPNNFFSVAKAANTSYTGGFGASVLDNTILGSGSGNYYVSQYSNLAIGGAGATNANIFGDLISVSNRASSTLIGSTSTIEGVDIFNNMETPTTTGYGVFAYASTGSVDAAGTGTISAINGTGGIHNGGATNVNAGEFRLFNAASGAATATNAKVIRAYVTNNVGNAITNLRGLSFDTWTNLGTVSAGGSVIFSDNSPDAMVTYFINSASTKPSKLAGDVYITDTTKGIILTSPNGTCYRFTVANGGALSAGAAITCP